MLCLLLMGASFLVSAQESEVTLEFENSETASQLVQNYLQALQEGNIEKMNQQLHANAMIYGLGGGLDSLNVSQHKDYYSSSTANYNHKISDDLYLPVKVKNNWNEGEWLLSWGTNTLTDKANGKSFEVPYHTASLIKDGKIVMIRYYYDSLNIRMQQGYTLNEPKK